MATNPNAEVEDSDETYKLPDSSGIKDEYTKRVWDQAVSQIESDEPDDNQEEDDDNSEDQTEMEDDDEEEASQHAEEHAEKLKEFENSDVPEAVRKLKEQLAEYHDYSEDLLPVAMQIETELLQLQPVIESALTTSNVKHFVDGFLEIWREVPANIAKLKELPASLPPVIPPPTIPLPSLLPPEPPKVSLPILEQAVETIKHTLAEVGVNYIETAEKVKNGSFAVTGDITQSAVEELKDIFNTALEEGHSVKRFVETVNDKLGVLSEPHLETIFRTNAASYKSDGKLDAVRHPVVSDAFPYIGYTATRDARVRPHHLELEKLGLQGTNIYRADDPTFLKFRPPWSYNCRCTWYPVSVEFAAKKGVKEAVDWRNRAEELAKQTGNSWYQHINDTVPSSGEHVVPPDFNPEPEFERSEA